ncbi:DNA repair and recombination protein, putative helicase [Fulvivirga imtechensis AK7]|uniref:DNA repair and recombination protein, putative helicase n=1 Tax=Fulvivirga imtechensis AK7 TaxID=1237149 RepID=L8JZ29_9BACT|nr:helix-turn-helix domain-containing protein [Fulvivirga imtechensis]ELR73433.1 DNA repair and recombination protein, putative helicase [Fulvivirga imtechensis AK7]
MEHDPLNKNFEMAVQFVNQTGRHLFLTGKAGTGKTTFLKYIKENSPKKLAIVAPTGVAAINAGGVTIHSLFQLPFGIFSPASQPVEVHTTTNVHNKTSLLKHLRINKDKRKLIRGLDLLVIDEVSMVRADLLDAVDVVLRHIRHKPHLPFGGVQMLYIGDLFQLPPVMKDEDWRILKDHYRGSFFFHAHALRQSPPLYMELKKIYRQSDEAFISLLNNLRNDLITNKDIQLLQKYYHPDFKPERKGEYIILTTHNSKADVINQKELDAISDPLFTYEAQIDGTFNESALPAERQLKLKKGAQVMFIRNDKGESRRYYNGKIGTVSRLNKNEIYVTFPGEPGKFQVEKEIWENIRYTYNQEADEVEEQVIGSFSQFPLRLAWAITIHKSQGLTFNKAIIDAGASFAAGQVYVALSRLTSLDGLVLYSPITPDCISTDEEANAFSKTALDEPDMLRELKMAQRQYMYQMLLDGFDWNMLSVAIENFKNDLENRRIPVLKEAEAMANDLSIAIKRQEETAGKFTIQLQKLLSKAEKDGYQHICERVKAAEEYFCDQLQIELLAPLESHIVQVKKQPKVKKYLQDVVKLTNAFNAKKQQIEQLTKVTHGLINNVDPVKLLEEIRTSHKLNAMAMASKAKEEVSSKPLKGESHRLSLSMFKEGKSIEDIAQERNLSAGTIEGHLASFITSGQIDIEALVSKDKIAMIRQVIETVADESASQIKEKLGDEFTYGEIRAVLNYIKLLAANER